MMTPRECYVRIALFKKADYIPNLEGVNERVQKIWRGEGFPEDATVEEFFDLDPKPSVYRGISFDPLPGVAQFVEGEDKPDPGPGFDVGRDPWGRIAAWHHKEEVDDEWAEGAYTIIRGGLQDRAEWEALRDQFEDRIDERYGAGLQSVKWEDFVARSRSDTCRPYVVEGPSMCGAIKEKMGFENYCLKLYDEPDMMEEIMEVRTELALRIMGKAWEEAQLDMLWFWEDMAFRNGPILSPEMFERLAVPRYRRLADWFRAQGGEIVAVDSDGDVRSLIPGWIRGGINHIWPLEPFAGVDVAALRAEYGQAFSMRGGVDKFCISKGREAIDREIDKIAPVVQGGGYIPHLDHRLPDCHFEDYCYYMERKNEVIGPRPPREERLGCRAG